MHFESLNDRQRETRAETPRDNYRRERNNYRCLTYRCLKIACVDERVVETEDDDQPVVLVEVVVVVVVVVVDVDEEARGPLHARTHTLLD